MSNNEELKKVTVENNGETRTFTYSKEIEEALMKYHGLNAADELKNAALYELKREQAEREENK